MVIHRFHADITMSYYSACIRRCRKKCQSDMRTVVLLLFCLYVWPALFSQLCLAGDSLKLGEKISGDAFLASSGEMFKLGFFFPIERPGRSYLGIWYYNVTPQTVVWVANRDSPVVDSVGVFEIAKDGNLQVTDTSGKRYWSSELVGSSSKNKTVRLMDSGNLVLRDDDDGSGIIQWQSFEHPTDTFLWGMRMDKYLNLTSWRAPDDPGRGYYTFKLAAAEKDQFIILKNQSQLYWKSERLDSGAISPRMVLLLSNLSSSSSVYKWGNKSFIVESVPVDYRLTRLLMNSTGQIQLLKWNINNTKAWTVEWQDPDNICKIFNYCGVFSICDSNVKDTCSCLPGFKNLTYGRCVRKSPLCPREYIRFYTLTVKEVKPDKTLAAVTETQCQDECLSACSLCQAYSYNASTYSDRTSSTSSTSSSTCFIWTNELPTFQKGYHRDGLNLSLLVHDSDLEKTNPLQKEPSAREISSSTNRLPLVLMVVFAGMFTLVCTIIFGYVWRKKKNHKQDRAVQRIQESLYDSERHVKGLIGIEGVQGNDNEGSGVPCISFENILAATDNFSDVNKLGRGGYGPVYKGTLTGGQDIAVKRLSSVSAQGLQEFKNEVVLIAKLQHRNLVRLKGYCIKEDEKILVYEYMPNKSLDSFVFDRTRTILLHWKLRFDIILGIARGLLYLHQDSRLRVIHRDLKIGNILLDEEMNPKISDFGLAKIFGGKETEASTERVVGTYGYMAPEYALDGLISIKSDVFSFGVVLLEIISGKRNSGFSQSNEASSLLGYAWRLWTENKLQDLMDPCLRENCNANQFIKCATIGLLCVQDEPIDRPNMSRVAILLESEIATLPTPNKPTFFASRGLTSTASSFSSKPETCLHIETGYLEG